MSLETQNPHTVSLRQLAKRLGINQSQARKYVLKLGYRPPQARTADSRGKLTYVFTEEESESIFAARRQNGFVMGDTRGTPVVADAVGVFYIVQIIPELDANRLKFGFAANVQERLSQHRTSAPTARILRSWPSRRTWEPMLIDCVASRGCELILNEVYECRDLAALIGYAESLFRLLPDPTHRVPLSGSSPIKKDVATKRLVQVEQIQNPHIVDTDKLSRLFGSAAAKNRLAQAESIQEPRIGDIDRLFLGAGPAASNTESPETHRP